MSHITMSINLENAIKQNNIYIKGLIRYTDYLEQTNINRQDRPKVNGGW